MALKSTSKPLRVLLDPYEIQLDPVQMPGRKNILFYALLLNCIYFLGVSFFVNRQLSNKSKQQQGLTWLNNAAKMVLEGLILDFSQPPTKIPIIMSEITQAMSFSEKTKIAQNYQLSAVVELTPESHIEILGKRRNIPFESGHFKQNTIGFHKEEDQLVFSHLWKSQKDPSPKKFFISYKKPIEPVLQQISVFGVDLSVVEKEKNDQRVLFSSLTNETAQYLLTQNAFEPIENSWTQWTLNKEKYLIKIVNLSSDPELQQNIIFSLKLPNYEVVSLDEFLIYIWTFFCISVVFLFLVFKKSEPSDKLQKHQ